MSEAPGAGPGPRPAPPTPGRAAPPVLERLGFRLSSLFAVALLPLGLVSLLQAVAWLDASGERAAAALLGETLRASAREAGLIREAQGAAAALARTLGPTLGDEAACDRAVDAVRADRPQYSLVAVIPTDGRMRCASDGRSFDFAGLPLFDRVVAEARPAITVNPRGPVSGTSVIGVLHPVPGADGAPVAFVSLSMPHDALSSHRPAARPGAGEAVPDFVTFDAEGTVLTASVGFERASEVLPLDLPLAEAVARGDATFTARAPGGEERVYSVAPLIEGELFALGSVPARRAVTFGGVAIVAPFLLAALLWVGSLLVAWFAAERLVTRYIRQLSHAIGAFAGGSRVVGDLDMARAPAEIREVGHAFLRMTDTILHDEAELEDTVHQKEVLLREVHHRVKNNLQLIASIMNMQMRRARSPETRVIMASLQERVMSLATVHRELYQTTGLADVRADELLGDIVRQIVAMASGPGRRFAVETALAPIRLTPDQAVPLSLLLTEGLTNALKYAAARPGEAAPRLVVALSEPAPGRAELSIRNSNGGAFPKAGPPEGDGTGLGGQLMAAFASQLGATVETGPEGSEYALRMGFDLVPLEGAEERRATA